jgi:hypothetical protein
MPLALTSRHRVFVGEKPDRGSRREQKANDGEQAIHNKRREVDASHSSLNLHGTISSGERLQICFQERYQYRDSS